MQAARLARTRLHKSALTSAFFQGKERSEIILTKAQNGSLSLSELNGKNTFELQHHHLMKCLEQATVRPHLFSC